MAIALHRPGVDIAHPASDVLFGMSALELANREGVPKPERRAALEDLLWSLLNAKEFVLRK